MFHSSYVLCKVKIRKVLKLVPHYTFGSIGTICMFEKNYRKSEIPSFVKTIIC